MIKKIFIIICIISSHNLAGQNENKLSYSGGMLFFQPGYTITKNEFHTIKNKGFGIGGIIRFYLKNKITLGIYGGNQKTNYSTPNSNQSYLNLGYGGGFIGASFKSNKIRYTISGFAGKGRIKNLHIKNQDNNKLSEAYLYNESNWVYSPILSIDYLLTPKISAGLQTVCLYTKFKDQTLYNPIIQIGILFNR